MTKKIFLLSGEASGDALGAKLMDATKELDHDVSFYGIGGEKMEELGLESLFPMSELSLLGFVEIIPHIPHLLRRIEETVNYIERINPDIIITIDAPAFNFRVVKKLKERGNNTKLVHYVAPSVWAYKPKRAEKIANLYDHLLALLPFEPQYFEKVGLNSTFVGHPIIEDKLIGGDGVLFRQKNGIYKNANVVYLMPGSRESEIKRLLPIFSEALSILNETTENLHAIILSGKGFFEEIEKTFKNHEVATTIITKKDDKPNALAASDIGLVKSGTGTLELALANIPMVVTYKVNPLSAWALRRMIKVPYVNLINILLNAPVIPELLQEDCNPEYLAAAISSLLDNKDARRNQLINTQQAMQMLSAGSRPSHKAAETILKLI
jgi:lipid-A-disaccharide synthase